MHKHTIALYLQLAKTKQSQLQFPVIECSALQGKHNTTIISDAFGGINGKKLSFLNYNLKLLNYF